MNDIVDTLSYAWLRLQKEKNNMITRDDEVYLVRWKKDGYSSNSGCFQILGKVNKAYIQDGEETYYYGSNKEAKVLRSANKICIDELSTNLPDISSFAELLSRMTKYAEKYLAYGSKPLLPTTYILKYEPTKVICSGPCVIVFWDDGTKTIVRAQGTDICDYEKGLAMAFAKKCLGNKGNYCNTFKKWLIGKDWRKKEREQHKQNKILKAVEEARKAVKPKKKTDTRHKGSSSKMDHEDMGG